MHWFILSKSNKQLKVKLHNSVVNDVEYFRRSRDIRSYSNRL